MPALQRAQRDVGQPLQVQSENAEVERLLDQQDGLLGEVLLVAHEGEDHPDRQAVAQRQAGRKIDGDDILQPKMTRSCVLKRSCARPSRTLAFTTSA